MRFSGVERVTCALLFAVVDEGERDGVALPSRMRCPLFAVSVFGEDVWWLEFVDRGFCGEGGRSYSRV